MAKSKIRSILKIIVTMLVAIVFILASLLICLIISQFLQSNEFSLLSVSITVGSISISLLISTFSHKFGHILMGNILHYQLISFGFNDIVMIPTQKKPTIARQIAYYISGILCNLILGVALFIALCLLPVNIPTIPFLFLVALSFTLIITAALQTISYYSDGVPTDGKLIWGLLFHSDFARYYIANTNLLTALKAGQRPGQIPMRSYEADDEIQTSDIMLLLYLYYKALDLKKASVMVKYAKILEDNLSIIPQHLHASIICELCHANAIMGLDEQASTYYAILKTLPAEDRTMSYYRALAYYFFYCKNNPKQALSSISYAVETADSCEFSGMRAMEWDLIQSLLQDISGSV